ncbi:MAG: Glycosyl transferase, family 2 [Candidatus Beckwithbacteria bacterium GW2011_GWA2_43_10]|uniref:Glycosyl transferase, family 2 n=1 Tax=Candidatus Beckwithbacteria bacterium GW2011_GWA2_43_10 TaxID=1618369 RepID=A0A0G1C1V9_9BACT|nr:MAG: Glycosyl transferase, family 2 [Candidatus Beckwithbacteria bacterium GW2011_GWA2_43_10]
MSLKPTISICIPTFNRADYLEQALQSLAQQTIKPFEVIIVDNASTDNTPQIAAKYKKLGFTYVRNPKNLGMVGNYNRCLELARGQYLSFLHSDDLISPTWQETWLETIANHPADFYTCSICIINQHNQPLFIYHTFNHDCLIPAGQVLRQLLLHHCPIIAPTAATVFKTSLLRKIAPFKTKLGTEADVDIFLRLSLQHSLFYKRQILFYHRSHPEQTFDTKKQVKSTGDRLEKIANYFTIVKDFSQTQLQNQPYQRLFILMNVFMTLCSPKLYLSKLKLARKIFPDIFTQTLDWKVFLSVQTLFIFRALLRPITGLRQNIPGQAFRQLPAEKLALRLWSHPDGRESPRRH